MFAKFWLAVPSRHSLCSLCEWKGCVKHSWLCCQVLGRHEAYLKCTWLERRTCSWIVMLQYDFAYRMLDVWIMKLLVQACGCLCNLMIVRFLFRPLQSSFKPHGGHFSRSPVGLEILKMYSGLFFNEEPWASSIKDPGWRSVSSKKYCKERSVATQGNASVGHGLDYVSFTFLAYHWHAPDCTKLISEQTFNCPFLHGGGLQNWPPKRYSAASLSNADKQIFAFAVCPVFHLQHAWRYKPWMRQKVVSSSMFQGKHMLARGACASLWLEVQFEVECLRPVFYVSQ